MLSRRVILRTVFLLPILLCLAGWLWSSTNSTGVCYGDGDRAVYLGTEVGIVRVEEAAGFARLGWWWGNDPLNPPQFWPPMTARTHTWFLGFSYRYDDFMLPRPGHFRGFAIPYWFPLVVSGSVFAWVWRKTRRKPAPSAFPVEVAAPSPPPAASPKT